MYLIHKCIYLGGEHSRQRKQPCVSKDSSEVWRLVE